MTKIQFRLLVLFSFISGVLGAVFDVLWPNNVLEQAEYVIYELEPEPSDLGFLLMMIVGFAALILSIITYVGILLFKSWARRLYTVGFAIILSIYPFLGVSVYSGMGLLIYDLSMIASGAILALMYYSPVSSYFESEI